MNKEDFQKLSGLAQVRALTSIRDPKTLYDLWPVANLAARGAIITNAHLDEHARADYLVEYADELRKIDPKQRVHAVNELVTFYNKNVLPLTYRYVLLNLILPEGTGGGNVRYLTFDGLSSKSMSDEAWKDIGSNRSANSDDLLYASVVYILDYIVGSPELFDKLILIIKSCDWKNSSQNGYILNLILSNRRIIESLSTNNCIRLYKATHGFYCSNKVGFRSPSDIKIGLTDSINTQIAIGIGNSSLR